MIAEAMPAVVPIGRAFIQYYMEERQIDKRTQAQQEIIEAQQEAQQTRARQPAGGAQMQQQTQQQPQQRQPQQETGAMDDRIEELVSDESCSTCAAALRGIKGEPRGVQETGIDEYHELKRVAESADSPQEVSEFLDGTEVIGEAMETAVL